LSWADYLDGREQDVVGDGVYLISGIDGKARVSFGSAVKADFYRIKAVCQVNIQTKTM
jgi:hypothetical protein